MKEVCAMWRSPCPRGVFLKVALKNNLGFEKHGKNRQEVVLVVIISSTLKEAYPHFLLEMGNLLNGHVAFPTKGVVVCFPFLTASLKIGTSNFYIVIWSKAKSTFRDWCFSQRTKRFPNS